VGVGLAAPSGWPTGVDPGEAANVSGALESAALVGDTVALLGSDDLLGVYVPLAHGSLGRHPGTVGVGEINGVGRNATGSAHFPNRSGNPLHGVGGVSKRMPEPANVG